MDCQHGWSLCPECGASVREQRRYEIARDVMAGFATRQGFTDFIGSFADDAIAAADAILIRLKAK